MNLVPFQLNDASRLEQARKERETAAFHRLKAEDCDRLASYLEAHASPDGIMGDSKVITDGPPVPAFLAQRGEAAA